MSDMEEAILSVFLGGEWLVCLFVLVSLTFISLFEIPTFHHLYI